MQSSRTQCTPKFPENTGSSKSSKHHRKPSFDESNRSMQAKAFEQGNYGRECIEALERQTAKVSHVIPKPRQWLRSP